MPTPQLSVDRLGLTVSLPEFGDDPESSPDRGIPESMYIIPYIHSLRLNSLTIAAKGGGSGPNRSRLVLNQQFIFAREERRPHASLSSGPCGSYG